jgi:cytochrome c oxidase subunit II
MNWTLFPATGYARDVATLWWVMFGVATAVWIAVVTAVIIAARRRRPIIEGNAPFLGEESPRTRKAVFAAFLATAGILFFFMGYDFVLGRETPQHVHRGGLDVTVQSRQWWWEFIYNDTVPELRLVQPNELHVPVGVPVNLIIKSSDVIHSVWVPRLAGKQDAVPGYTGALTFVAETSGRYDGVCAEFCGAQHANMRFLVIAHEKKEFDDWYAASRAPAPAAPADSLLAAGQRAFLSGSCSTCHTIAGTPAFGTRGPDLTHVGSRLTLASGALANTRENMLRWIIDPQAVKPGTQMPPANLPSETLPAVVAYLRSLK